MLLELYIYISLPNVVFKHAAKPAAKKVAYTKPRQKLGGTKGPLAVTRCYTQMLNGTIVYLPTKKPNPNAGK